MCSLSVCNFQKKYCGCQTYMEDENNPEKCFYCNHYNAFHTGFSPPPQNSSTPLLGPCQKDGASCGCQAFVANPNTELKCKYCDHFTAFHKQIIINTTSNGITPLPSSLTNADNVSSSMSSPQIQDPCNVNSINTSGDPKFKDQIMDNNNKSRSVIRKRKRNQSRFRNQHSPNTAASRGRPANVSLSLNHLLLFQQSWENSSAPRENTESWIEMRDNGLIIENVSFEENTPEAINAIITRSFPSVNEYNWILLNGSTSKLILARNQEISLKNFRNNMSKSNKRLYLALKETLNDSNETEADDQIEDCEIKSESSD
ncbi:hypothetical protein C1645_735991 [Glomus cerebriforme]|uniref:Uncharacterized protein n=1 Tax=Glomus cerebriforme TaxID=658196 RepID=A0A397T7L8_9GLOM|nr:hypothetical protein C1645_735991 [Glomus cerebriforme]